MVMQILIVEDNSNLAKSIERFLKQEKYTVKAFENGMDAERFWIINNTDIDLVILDVQLPGKNGFELCESVRDKNIFTPILMLTAKSEIEHVVKGLRVGADDYMTKPFSLDELLARIQALLRRPKTFQAEKVALSEGVFFHGSSRKVFKDGVEVSLTPKEFEILEFLIQHKNEAVSQQTIIDHCFDFAKEHWSNVIEVHIKNIRKKLFAYESEKKLKTVRGFGYRLEIE
jgi:DNA-binding response OmpR family regulator